MRHFNLAFCKCQSMLWYLMEDKHMKRKLPSAGGLEHWQFEGGGKVLSSAPCGNFTEWQRGRQPSRTEGFAVHLTPVKLINKGLTGI